MADLMLDSGELLGSGAESEVYAYGDDKIVRLIRAEARQSDVRSRKRLLAQLAGGGDRVSFDVPVVIDAGHWEGRPYTIESRISGEPLARVLSEVSGTDRSSRVVAYLEAATEIGSIAVAETRFGDLCRRDAIRTDRFRDYLSMRADVSLRRRSVPDRFGAQLAAEIAEPSTRALVHLDYCPGNVLISKGRVSGVLDFGSTTILGDPRFNLVVAVAYLDPQITPTATAADQRLGREWLRDRGLDDHYAPISRWLAAYWSFASSDQRLSGWCRSVLNA